MAFSKTPTLDTYSDHQVPLVHNYALAGGVADSTFVRSGMINVLPYRENETLHGLTRSGIMSNTVEDGANLVVRGIYIWEKTLGVSYYFCVITDLVNTSVYSSTDQVTWTAVNTFVNGSRAPVRFSEFISSTNTKSLVLVTGTKGYVYTDNTAGTEIVDADFPNPHVPFPVFLNGRLHLAKANTGDIYCSALDNPASWTAGDFISSEVYPDDIKALVKVDNYILAVGQSGSEYFYDAAKASGSPLARVEGSLLPFGTTFPNTIACNKTAVTLLANTGDGECSIITIEGLRFKQLEADQVLRTFTGAVEQGNFTFDQPRGMYFREYGRLLYCLQFQGDFDSDQSPVQSRTFVYCFDTQMWVRYTKGADQTFPVQAAGFGPTTLPLTFVAGVSGSEVFFGYLSSLTDVDELDLMTDIYQELRVPPQTFGTLNIKTMSRLGVMYQRLEDTTGPDITISCRDNHSTVESQTRTLAGNWEDGVGGFPFVTQLGSFKDRAFVVSTTGTGTRWEYLEGRINKGQR